jgi:membrane-associated phospholipid phosphatase
VGIRIDTFRGRFLVAAAVMAPLYGLYQVFNHIHLREPIYLTPGIIDRAMPFWPWTAYPYLLVTSAVYLMLWVYDATTFRKGLTAIAIAFSLNVLIWALVPTVIIRPEPPPFSFATLAYRLMILEDSPANCFPSGHVSMPALAVWAFLADRPRHRVWMWTVFSLCMVSLLTTKQHYAIDIAGGALTAVVGLAIAGRLVRSPDVVAVAATGQPASVSPAPSD